MVTFLFRRLHPFSLLASMCVALLEAVENYREQFVSNKQVNISPPLPSPPLPSPPLPSPPLPSPQQPGDWAKGRNT